MFCTYLTIHKSRYPKRVKDRSVHGFSRLFCRKFSMSRCDFSRCFHRNCPTIRLALFLFFHRLKLRRFRNVRVKILTGYPFNLGPELQSRNGKQRFDGRTNFGPLAQHLFCDTPLTYISKNFRQRNIPKIFELKAVYRTLLWNLPTTFLKNHQKSFFKQKKVIISNFVWKATIFENNVTHGYFELTGGAYLGCSQLALVSNLTESFIMM